jgi:pimeloyl-ACP methyl ester carboxylesterase
VRVSTFVLVHGAFNGAWVWQRVTRILRAAGHDALTPTLTGAGHRFHLLTRDVNLTTHVEDVVAAVVHEDLRDVVLVGHSYGGAVITVAADRLAERLRRVVYLDAAAPGNGQASTGAFAEGTSDKLAELSDADWLLPPLPLAVVGVTDARDGAWMDARRHPHPMATLHEPLRLSGESAKIPRSYIVHTQKQAMVELFGVDPLAPFVARAKQESWRMQEIAAGHDAMFTHPQQVAEALLAELA